MHDGDGGNLLGDDIDVSGRKQREDLLMFVTSCSRPPLLGFRELHPSFCIQKVTPPLRHAPISPRIPAPSMVLSVLNPNFPQRGAGIGLRIRKTRILAISCAFTPWLVSWQTSHNSEEADSRLPTASTCMNLLKLPCYNSVEACRERLLYAISAGAGFELS